MSAAAVNAGKPIEPVADVDGTRPDFIYGGPFIKVEKPTPFMDTATPINIELCGVFKQSYAYYSLTQRLPVILTKIIDYLSREGGSIGSADDVRSFLQTVTKLKNDLMTNKNYDKFVVSNDLEDPDEPRQWNEWIDGLVQPKYFTNTWLWTECYVYRKLWEGCLLTKSLQNFDYFGPQKSAQLTNNLEPICMVAEKMVSMLSEKPKDQKKLDFIMLIKLCLWANKSDLSLTLGEESKFTMPDIPPEQPKQAKKGAAGAAAPPKKGKGPAPEPKPLAPGVDGADRSMDPVAMILEMKDKCLVDDSGKIFENLYNKTEKMKGQIAGPPPEPPAPPAPAEGAPPAPPEPAEPPPPAKPIPCPTKITIPACVMFDIVCDNVGYELFTDMCVGTFLIKQNMVQKVRFHVKKCPWFVSDVMPKDIPFTIETLKSCSYSAEVKPDPKPGAPPAEGQPGETRTVTSSAVNQLAGLWAQWLDDGTFLIMSDDYWTYPHPYCEMKKRDYWMYRKLQFPAAIMFKGDLNYRKLLAERNTNPVVKLDASLQGFNPTSIIAVRTIKSDLICGLPKNKWEQLNALDPEWMRKGNYGVIQFVPKAEALKAADRPCPDYGEACRGAGCPHWALYYGAEPDL